MTDRLVCQCKLCIDFRGQPEKARAVYLSMLSYVNTQIEVTESKAHAQAMNRYRDFIVARLQHLDQTTRGSD